MRSEARVVDSGGKLEVTACYQVAFAPEANGAQFPLVMRINGDPGHRLVVTSDAPLKFGARVDSIVVDAQGTPGAVWRVTLAETAEETLEAGGGAWRRPVMLWRNAIEEGVTLSAGNIFRLNQVSGGQFATGVPFDDPMDVRGARLVLLKLAHTGFTGGAGTPTVTASLNLISSMASSQLAGSDSYERPAAGVVGLEQITCTLEAVPNALTNGLSYVQVGEGLHDSGTSTSVSRTRGVRWPFVTCTLGVDNTTSEDVVFAGGLVAELWVFP